MNLNDYDAFDRLEQLTSDVTVHHSMIKMHEIHWGSQEQYNQNLLDWCAAYERIATNQNREIQQLKKLVRHLTDRIEDLENPYWHR